LLDLGSVLARFFEQGEDLAVVRADGTTSDAQAGHGVGGVDDGVDRRARRRDGPRST
jgi:hypothetical protein